MNNLTISEVEQISDIETLTPNPCNIAQYFTLKTCKRAFLKNESVLKSMTQLEGKWVVRYRRGRADIMMSVGDLFGDGSDIFSHKYTMRMYNYCVEYISKNYKF